MIDVHNEAFPAPRKRRPIITAMSSVRKINSPPFRKNVGNV